MIATCLTLLPSPMTHGIFHIYIIRTRHVLLSAKFINYVCIGVTEDSFDSGESGRFIEDSIESDIDLLLRDSS